ncbi:hypothetical protein MMC07_005374 [Pseudocyphellaria aurata]|nr:hypothetical protein [Pseudocyphellaria aurata]
MCLTAYHQGPIIRINPTEIHISDPDFYDTIYSHVPVNKEESFRYRLGNPGSMHSTPEKDLHQKRRASLASYFSRRQVLKFSPYIQSCMDKLCHRLNNEYKGTSKVVSLDDAFAAFTADIITYYAFARSYDFLSYPDSESPFIRAIEGLSDSMQILAYLPWLIPMIESLPKFLSSALQPAIVPFTEYRDEIKTQIRKTINAQKGDSCKDLEHDADENIKHDTVFKEILKSNLPPEELTLSRLQDEAVIIVTAGIGPTKTTMTIACFHVLNNPAIYGRLCQELTNAFPDPTSQPTLPELEKLPYLTAVIQESLRFSYGASQRLPRIFDSAIEYGSYTIPRGVPVSQTCYIQHHDERIFPCSQSFIPDRWLSDHTKTPNHDDSPSLSHYLVSFCKGSRSCIGINLAHAELYIGLATVFRKVRMELFDTQRDAVDMAADHMVQVPKAGTKGVRVLVK